MGYGWPIISLSVNMSMTINLTTCGNSGVARRINDISLLGLDISPLRYNWFNECDIGDEVVVSIDHGCPHLAETKFCDCDSITDTSVITLGKYCSMLVFIDITVSTHHTSILLITVLKWNELRSMIDTKYHVHLLAEKSYFPVYTHYAPTTEFVHNY